MPKVAPRNSSSGSALGKIGDSESRGRVCLYAVGGVDLRLEESREAVLELIDEARVDGENVLQDVVLGIDFGVCA